MTTTSKILLGVGGVTILGLGIYFVTRKPGSSTTTTTTGGGDGLSGGNQQDPSTSTTDSLGTTIGNIIADLWASRENQKPNGAGTPGFVYEGPADPYSVEVNQTMGNAAVKTLQTTLSSCSPDIKKVIDDSGGTDGFLGPGTKTAYNMARKSGCINSSGQKIS
jgi:hypothetical protein